MVAYNFKSAFVPQIEIGRKRQTVRHHRRRHARQGERVQLFQGMRTKKCRKILKPDPICTRVDEIVIEVRKSSGITAIRINGIPLDDKEIELFACQDGFDPNFLSWAKGTGRELMSRFWAMTHPGNWFEGVVVHWVPA